MSDFNPHDLAEFSDAGWDVEFTRPPQTIEEISPEERERAAENKRRIARVAQATRSAK
jgi:hypothetical protein